MQLFRAFQGCLFTHGRNCVILAIQLPLVSATAVVARSGHPRQRGRQLRRADIHSSTEHMQMASEDVQHPVGATRTGHKANEQDCEQES